MATGNITAIQQEINTGISNLYAIRTGRMVTLSTDGNGFAVPSAGITLPQVLAPKIQAMGFAQGFYSNAWHNNWVRIRSDSYQQPRVLQVMNGSDIVSTDYTQFSVTYELANP